MTDCLSLIQAEIDKLDARSRKLALAYQDDKLSSAQYHHFTGLLAGLHSAKRLIIKAQRRGVVKAVYSKAEPFNSDFRPEPVTGYDIGPDEGYPRTPDCGHTVVASTRDNRQTTTQNEYEEARRAEQPRR
jgi:hypothetical protein